MSLMTLMVKKLLESFMKKNGKKINQEEFRIKKVINRKGANYMSNGKTMIVLLIVG